MNVTDLMKDHRIYCENLSTFLTLHQTLHFQLKDYNVFIRDVNALSEPKIFMNCRKISHQTKSALHDFDKITLHSLLSKDNVLPSNFSDGRNALSLTSNGFGVLKILLTRTDAKMTYIWACDKPIPSHIDHKNLNNCFIAMQQCFRSQLACGRK